MKSVEKLHCSVVISIFFPHFYTISAKYIEGCASRFTLATICGSFNLQKIAKIFILLLVSCYLIGQTRWKKALQLEFVSDEKSVNLINN